jgi:signal transduction histidine kinase
MTATAAAPALEAWSPVWRRVALGAVAVAGGVASAVTAADLSREPGRDPEVWSVLRGLVVATWIIVGMYTWWRRPGSRLGLFLIGIGLLYSGASFSASSDSLVHTAGRVALAVLVVALAYVFLCFPHDRLASQAERRLMAGLALATGVMWLMALPLVEKLPAGGPLTDCGTTCPDNALRLVTPPNALADGIGTAVNLVTAAGLLGVVAFLFGKVLAPARLRRRLVVPLLGSIIVLTLNYAFFTVLRDAGVDGTGLKVVGAGAALAIPFAMLVGQVRGRVFVASSVGGLVARVGREPVTPARVEALLRDALGDPKLTLALWEPEREGYVDVRGRAFQAPTGRPDLHVTSVTREGRTVAVLIHDASLEDGSGILEGFAATALMLLEKSQLVDELRASRARIVATAQAERLRRERNLHDGAQQRLFALQLKLSSAREEAGDGQLGHELDEIVEHAAEAVEELRDLAHGLYPTLLRERGLADAFRSLSRTAAVHVEVVDRSEGRCPAAIEEAVYFCGLEAIQNTAKHAGSDAQITVTLVRRTSDLEFMFEDDGPGFELGRQTDGIGIVSMRDRIGAVGGELVVVSHPGRGTTVAGVVPGCWPTDTPVADAAG